MSFLAGIGAVNALIRGASGLVREVKRPRMSNEEFANILRQKVDQAKITYGDSNRLQALSNEVTRMTAQFIAARDLDGNHSLNIQESGLNAHHFHQLDTDNDGELTHLELRAPFVQFLDTQKDQLLQKEER